MTRINQLWTPACAGVTAFSTFYEIINVDELVKSQKPGFSVIPAKAGIQLFQVVLDPGFRRGDDPRDFLRVHQCLVFDVYALRDENHESPPVKENFPEGIHLGHPENDI